MKIGVRAHDFGKHTAKDLASILKAHEIEAAQVALPRAIEGVENFSDVSENILKEVKAEFTDNGIAIPVLSCYIDASSQDEQFREAQVKDFMKVLEYSVAVGADMVGTETSYGLVTEEDRAVQFDILIDVLHRLVEKAEQVGAYIGIEAVTPHTMNSPEMVGKVLKTMNSDRIKVILDPVNLLTVSNMDKQEEIYKTCFEIFGEQIAAIHLKDFVVEDGKLVATPLGTGHMKYDYLFSWLKQNKPNICILREEIDPKTAKQDIEFMKKLIQ